MIPKRTVDEVVVTVDGSCVRRHTGIGIAVRVVSEDKITDEISQLTGRGTNNTAEYRAVIEACKWAQENLSYNKLTIFTDSQLVFKQLNGEYNLKNASLKVLCQKTKAAMRAARAYLRWHPRDDGDGPVADKLANHAVGDKK